MLPAHATLEGPLGGIRPIAIGSVEAPQQFSVLMAADELFQREGEEATARDVHFAGDCFSLFE